ncbi:hypothetical protein Tco_1363220 [Tanacetum coccineum]
MAINIINKTLKDKEHVNNKIDMAGALNDILDVDVRNPTIQIIPAPIHGSSDYCERVFVNGVSRKILGSFAKIYHVLLIPTPLIRYDWHNKAQICIHGDASLGLCQCEKEDWRPLRNGLWSFVMSCYENKIIDIKFTSGIHGSVYVFINEGLQGWRYLFLAMGIALLFLAPRISKYILSRDVDDMGGLFIKWVMRVIVGLSHTIAMYFPSSSIIIHSSVETPFAMVAEIGDSTVKLAEKSLARGDNKSK